MNKKEASKKVVEFVKDLKVCGINNIYVTYESDTDAGPGAYQYFVDFDHEDSHLGETCGVDFAMAICLAHDFCIAEAEKGFGYCASLHFEDV